jgi:hypothetical protein
MCLAYRKAVAGLPQTTRQLEVANQGRESNPVYEKWYCGWEQCDLGQIGMLVLKLWVSVSGVVVVLCCDDVQLTVVARTAAETSVTSRATNHVCGTSAVFFQVRNDGRLKEPLGNNTRRNETSGRHALPAT